MLNFDFYNPTHIVFGKDRISEIDKLIPEGAKVLVTYGGQSAKKHGTLDKVIEALGEREYHEFGGIEANPKYDTLIKAVEIVKTENIDFLLAVGGGSVMDGTKFISLAANYEGEDMSDILFKGAGSKIKNAIPLGTIVTLPATGSEMNSGGVISHKDGKLAFFSPLVFPKFSVLDPTLTYTLPKTQVANGIIDTFIHTCEQYVTFPAEGRFQDRAAEGILLTLIEIGQKTLEEPEDYDARANLVWTATMGLNGLIGAGVPQDWATHMIGHELTNLFGIDHGKSLAVIQPALWRIRKEQKKDKLIQFAERVWNIDVPDEDEKIELAIQKTREFFESLGVKTHLSDYGITEHDLDRVIGELEKHRMTRLSETRDLGLEESLKILKEAL